MKQSRLPPIYYTAIFIIALSTLAVQILVGRILSVTFYYHFAFVGITLAMLGLTAGALKVYQQPEEFGAANAAERVADYASRFAASIVLAVLLHVYIAGLVVPVLSPWLPQAAVIVALVAMIVGSLMLAGLAFIHSGIAIALLLTRFPAHTARLYAFDLAGAALGSVLIIVALKLFDPISTFMLIGIALSLLAWRLLPQQAEVKLARRVKATSVTLAVLCAVQLMSAQAGAPVFRLLWAKSSEFSTPPLFEQWNTYSRVAVREYFDGLNPFGWGYGRAPAAQIEQKWLDIDADAATVITAFNGDTSKIAYLKGDIINLGYHLRDIGSVAVIGVGGGRDILSGLAFGAKSIQGIELNPAIFEALTKRFGDFAGHLDKRPEVSLVNAEARSYLNSSTNRYDLIQISLIDTWATTAAGGLTLSENKLYTTDAWKDFLARLNDGGMLVVSRWYDSDTHRGEFYRMLAIAAHVIAARDPKADPRQHMLAATVNKIVTFALSAKPLSKADIARFHAACKAHGFTPMLTPSFAIDETAATIASGKAGADFFASLALDVTPPSDDRPFFFNMVRPADYLSGKFLEDTTVTRFYANNKAVSVLMLLSCFTFAAALWFIVMPLMKSYRKEQINAREALPHMLYFAAIGLGFMLIEVSQMQRLIIFLGHPVYGLSVVLFTLLLFSSLGSYVQSRRQGRALHVLPALLCAVLFVTGLITPAITEQLKSYDTSLRIILSGLLIAPMAFFMGTMFPIGVALLSSRQESRLPWYWGINGAASVFASVFAVVLSLQSGIAATFWVGVTCYLFCLLLILRLQRKKATS